jgi:hypothetical protein
MQNLRAALEKLDEAIDQLDDLAVAVPTPAASTITPRSPSEIYRAEIIRRLDVTIQDVQGLMEHAA